MAEEAKASEETTSEEVESPSIAEEALKVALDTESKTEEAESKEEAAEEKAEAEDETDSKTDEPEAEVEAKEKNQVGYLTRQLKQKDEYIAKLETNLKDNYVDQGSDDNEQRIRNLEVRQYVKEVEQARSSIVSDNEKVARDIPLFNPESPDYNQTVHERALARYARDSIIADESGEIVGYKVPLYDYLKEEADLYSIGTESGAKKGKTATAKMAASAETPGAASRRKSASDEDPFLTGFNSI